MDTNDSQTDLLAALLTATKQHDELLTNYQELSLCNELTDKASDQLDQIYAKALNDPMLNFLLTEIDHILNSYLGLLSDEAVGGYKDQQAWLRERLEQTPFEHRNCQEVQKMLAEAGFYEGPIDGVIGPRSTQALKQMTIQIQENLSQRGFYNQDDIDGFFGRSSRQAVKAFQQSWSLEDSGLPNRETLIALRSE